MAGQASTEMRKTDFVTSVLDSFALSAEVAVGVRIIRHEERYRAASSPKSVSQPGRASQQVGRQRLALL